MDSTLTHDPGGVQGMYSAYLNTCTPVIHMSSTLTHDPRGEQGM